MFVTSSSKLHVTNSMNVENKFKILRQTSQKPENTDLITKN